MRDVSGPIRKIITGVALFVAVCLVAVIGYMASGWKLDDAIYMVVITIFGVGYGEVQPIQSPALRGLTILVIVAGYGAVLYTVGGFMQMLIDGELNKVLGARRMTKEIGGLQGHAIVCGIGRMGTILARELTEVGQPFVVLDRDADRVRIAEEHGYLVLHGDATEEETLKLAGIERAAVLATVLSDDALNVFVTITARQMNASIAIIARGESPRTERKLLACGANRVVLPTAIGATKIAQLITRPTAENLLESLANNGAVQDDLHAIGLRFHELAVASDSRLDGMLLSDMELRCSSGVLVVGIQRLTGETIVKPSDDTRLCRGDRIIVLGHADELPEMLARSSRVGQRVSYRGATY